MANILIVDISVGKFALVDRFNKWISFLLTAVLFRSMFEWFFSVLFSNYLNWEKKQILIKSVGKLYNCTWTRYRNRVQPKHAKQFFRFVFSFCRYLLKCICKFIISLLHNAYSKESIWKKVEFFFNP